METTDTQKGAIKEAARVGKLLQDDFPEIVEDYRKGFTRLQIAEKYKLFEIYNVNKKTTLVAISYALGGNNGIYRSEKYDGLIKDPSELERLSKEHKAKNLNNISLEKLSEARKRLYEERRGIHGLSRKEKSRYGKVGGEKAMRERKGIFGMSPEKRKEAARKANLSLGNILWSDEERDFTYQLSQNPEYQIVRRRDTRRNNIKIVEEINRVFHNGNPIRTKRATLHFFQEYKKINGAWNYIRKNKQKK